VIRSADFGPMPGSFVNSWIRRPMAPAASVNSVVLTGRTSNQIRPGIPGIPSAGKGIPSVVAIF
jgi:hypothetical protein